MLISSLLASSLDKGVTRLQAYYAYARWSIEPISSGKKGTIKAHTAINNQFMSDLNILTRVKKDLSSLTMILDRYFTIVTPGKNNTE